MAWIDSLASIAALFFDHRLDEIESMRTSSTSSVIATLHPLRQGIQPGLRKYQQSPALSVLISIGDLKRNDKSLLFVRKR
jgi:hypothetical protein